VAHQTPRSTRRRGRRIRGGIPGRRGDGSDLSVFPRLPTRHETRRVRIRASLPSPQDDPLPTLLGEAATVCLSWLSAICHSYRFIKDRNRLGARHRSPCLSGPRQHGGGEAKLATVLRTPNYSTSSRAASSWEPASRDCRTAVSGIIAYRLPFAVVRTRHHGGPMSASWDHPCPRLVCEDRSGREGACASCGCSSCRPRTACGEPTQYLRPLLP